MNARKYISALLAFAVSCTALGASVPRLFPDGVKSLGGFIGANTGAAPCTGCIGEKLEASSLASVATATPAEGTWYDSGLSITLTPGEYDVKVSGHGALNYSSWTAGFAGMRIALATGTTGSPTVIQGGGFAQSVTSAAAIFQTVSLESALSVTATTTYKLFYGYTSYSGSSYVITSVGFRGDVHKTFIRARRVGW